MGNAFLDPTTFGKAVILYGVAGTGKSTLLALIGIALMAAVEASLARLSWDYQQE